MSKVFENFTLQIIKIGHELTSGYFCVWKYVVLYEIYGILEVSEYVWQMTMWFEY